MSNTENSTVRIKQFEELEFRDDFMFDITMRDKELCRDVIERLTGQPVGELVDVQAQKEFRTTVDGKPIRLDIYTKDDATVYDAEMQNLNKKPIDSLALPKRTRFYQSSIDMDFISRGGYFKNLPESKIMFICTFDPFGKGMSKYTFRERCDENPEMTISDGAEKIFFNCCYENDDISEGLRSFYDYVEYGKASDDLTRRIETAVQEARKSEKWRSVYMKERALFQELKEEGREEGRAEERKNTEQERIRAEKAEAELRELKAKYDLLLEGKNIG